MDGKGDLRPSMRKPGCTVGTAPSPTPDCVTPLRKQCPKNTPTAPAESVNCCPNVTVSSFQVKTSNPGPEAKPDRSSPEDAHVYLLGCLARAQHPRRESPLILPGAKQSSMTHHLCCQHGSLCTTEMFAEHRVHLQPGSGPSGLWGEVKQAQGTLTLGEGSSMLSPCQPEMGTKGTVAGL